jgi:small subunit ribosomal protein S20
MLAKKLIKSVGGYLKLANTASAKKRIRSSARRQERNRHFRAAARTYVKRTHLLIEQGELDSAEEMSRQAASTLDKAARKGIVHPRNAARRKSRLMKALAAAREAQG